MSTQKCPTKEKQTMLYTQTTIWEGTPEALLNLIEASKKSAPIHEKFGAKNPRILEPVLGGETNRLHYCIDFDSVEAQGRFADSLESSGWMAGAHAFVTESYPNLKLVSTGLFVNRL